MNDGIHVLYNMVLPAWVYYYTDIIEMSGF